MSFSLSQDFSSTITYLSLGFYVSPIHLSNLTSFYICFLLLTRHEREFLDSCRNLSCLMEDVMHDSDKIWFFYVIMAYEEFKCITSRLKNVRDFLSNLRGLCQEVLAQKDNNGLCPSLIFFFFFFLCLILKSASLFFLFFFFYLFIYLFLNLLINSFINLLYYHLGMDQLICRRSSTTCVHLTWLNILNFIQLTQRVNVFV